MNKSLIATGCLGVLLIGGTRILGQDKGDAAKGKATFEEQCSVCHNADNTDTKVGPGLKGLFMHDKLNNGKKPTEENVRAMINGGGNGMPAFGDLINDEDKANLIAYLKTL
jgi:cytochrome c